MAGAITGEGKTLKEFPQITTINENDLLLVESQIEGTRTMKYGTFAENMGSSEEVQQAIETANEASTKADTAIANAAAATSAAEAASTAAATADSKAETADSKATSAAAAAETANGKAEENSAAIETINSDIDELKEGSLTTEGEINAIKSQNLTRLGFYPTISIGSFSPVQNNRYWEFGVVELQSLSTGERKIIISGIVTAPMAIASGQIRIRIPAIGQLKYFEDTLTNVNASVVDAINKTEVNVSFQTSVTNSGGVEIVLNRSGAASWPLGIYSFYVTGTFNPEGYI